MTVGIKLAGADLAFKGGLLNGNRYAGLFSAEGTELTGNNYGRQLLALSDWQADGAEYENAAQEVWGPPQPAAWLAVTHWGLFSAETSGNLLLDVDITDTNAPGIGASVAAAMAQIGWSFTGQSSTAGSVAALSEGMLSSTRYLTLHSAATPLRTDDGESSTSNTISTNGASDGSGTPLALTIAAADWTVDTQPAGTRRARNNKVMNFGIQTADLPDPLSVALRDGNQHTSNILWHTSLTADDPSLGDALSFAANALVMTLPFTN